MVVILKFTSNFFLSLVHAIHGHMTRYGWNPDWTLLELAWNPDWTGMEPGLNSYGSIRVPCQFNQGSRPVQSGFNQSSIRVPAITRLVKWESSQVQFHLRPMGSQLDYNWPAMDSTGSQLEMCVQFLTVPCMLGTNFFLYMRGLRKHTWQKQSLTLEGHNKWVK